MLDLDKNLDIVLYLLSMLIVGYPVFLDFLRAIASKQLFNENFLMTIAAAGAFAIGEYPEGIAVLMFYQIGSLFEDYAVDRSRKSISSLTDLIPDHANLITEKGITEVGPEEVEIGDRILIRPGERIPLDGTVTDGTSLIDMSSVTGESVPKRVSADDKVLSGCISVNGAITVSVTSLHADSTASRIISMIEDAYESKSKSENFVTKFARYYTPAVIFAAFCLAVLPTLLFSAPFEEWLYRALTFLVISCPCALVISIPLAFFGGIGGASRLGILVKGGNYLEALAKADAVVFDKTGTLTEGTFDVEKIIPYDADENELLTYAAYAEGYSNHPIAVSIRNAYGKDIDPSRIGTVEEIAGEGVVAKIDGLEVLVGNDILMSKNGIEYPRSEEFGTIVHVSAGGRYKGRFVIMDRIRPDSKNAIALLKKIGISNISMLTGDVRAVGEHVAGAIGIDSVYADLLPADKIKIVESMLSQGRSVAFVGDGINDSPSLARADVGIAMSMGSDVAIEAADIVIMDNMPSKVPVAIKISKKTRMIAAQNIVFALSIKMLFLILGAFGHITLIEAVFADVGVAVIAILNSMRTLRISNFKKWSSASEG